MKKNAAIWLVLALLSISLLAVGAYYLQSIETPEMGFTLNHVWPVIVGLIGTCLSIYKFVRSL